ncbi:hypothetical protein BC833DRAFT_657610 [Globomyces pollinis-pini]|nr:hypothetical protein BC833DRAFT_657610 [Globomyces pollinis-pini]
MASLTNHEQNLHPINNWGLDKRTVHSISTIEVHTESPLTKTTVLDALYRTISKCPQLSSVVDNGKFKPAGTTLADLDLDVEFIEIIQSLTKFKKEKELKADMNRPLNEYLGYRFKFFITQPVKGRDKTVVQIHTRISILQSLMDESGLKLLHHCFGKSLEEAIISEKQISLATPLKNLEDGINVKSISSQTLYSTVLLMLQYTWNLVIGFWLLNQFGRNFIIRHFKYSGSKDPSNVDQETVKNPNGIRLIELPADRFNTVMVEGKKINGSITSIIAISGLIAYQDLATHQKAKFSDVYNVVLAADSRAPDVYKSKEFLRNQTYQLYFYGYKLNQGEEFWKHVLLFETKVQTALKSLLSFIQCYNFIPTFFIKRVMMLQKLNQKRDYQLQINDLGTLNIKDEELSNRVYLTDCIVTSNSFYTGNRSLLQITSLIVKDKLQLMIGYPTYMITEDEIDYFIDSLLNVLDKAVQDPSVTCLKAQATKYN